MKLQKDYYHATNEKHELKKERRTRRIALASTHLGTGQVLFRILDADRPFLDLRDLGGIYRITVNLYLGVASLRNPSMEGSLDGSSGWQCERV